MSVSQGRRSSRLGRRLLHLGGAAALATIGLSGLVELAGQLPAFAGNGSGQTTVTVTASPTSAAPGSTITVTAVVAPVGGGATPTGSVDFFIDGSQVGTTNCTASNGTAANCLDSTGTATTQLTNLGSGTWQVYASYSGDSNYARVPYSNSTFATVTIGTVSVDNTTTSLSIEPGDSVTSGQTVTLVATVIDQNGLPVTSGSVTFFNATTNTTIDVASLSSSGTASYASATWAVGSSELEATYQGPVGSDYSGSGSGLVTLSVTGGVTIDNTTTTLAISPAEITANQSTALEATVVDENDLPVTSGDVTFVNVTTNVTLAVVPLNSAGQATYLATDWPSGTFTVAATYEGPTTFSSSGETGEVSVLPNPADTTTTVTSVSPSPVLTGQPFQISASVAADEATQPSGTVTFYADGSPIGSGSLGPNGTATFTDPGNLPAGSYELSASYGGDSLDNPSPESAAVPLVIEATDTSSTAASATPGSSQFGTPVSLSATVTPGSAASGTPSGTVSFTLGSAGGTPLCTANLASGTGSCTATGLPVGTDTIVATYSGDTAHTGSSSTTTEVVSAASTDTTAAASPATSVQGSKVTLSAQVTTTSPSSVAPTGTVSFTLGSASGTPLCTAELTSAGAASCAFAGLPVGTDTVVATYSGDANYAGSSAQTSEVVSTPVTVTVSGSQTHGSSVPSFSYTVSAPSGVTVTGALVCTTVDGGTPISSALLAGFYTIDGSSCSGLRASLPSDVITYVGANDGYLVSATCGTTATFTIPLGAGSGLTSEQHGNVVVPPGQSLYVDGGTLQGNVWVSPGASFYMSSGSVEGNLFITGAARVIITGGTLAGNLQSTASPLSIAGATIDGNVQVLGGSLLSEGNAIGGNLQTQGILWVGLCGGTVGGNVEMDDTLGAPPSSVSSDQPPSNFLCAATIHGNLLLNSNPPWVRFELGQGPDCASGLTVHGGQGPGQCHAVGPRCCNNQILTLTRQAAAYGPNRPTAGATLTAGQVGHTAEGLATARSRRG